MLESDHQQPVDNGINGDIEDTAVAPREGRWLSKVIYGDGKPPRTDRATDRD